MVKDQYEDTGKNFFFFFAIQAEDDKKALKKLFIMLMEYFECYNSKHDSTHLVIKVKNNSIDK